MEWAAAFANLDKAFDKGFITFEVHGSIRLSPPHAEAGKLGITPSIKIALKPEHEKYMPHHRAEEFKQKNGSIERFGVRV